MSILPECQELKDGVVLADNSKEKSLSCEWHYFDLWFMLYVFCHNVLEGTKGANKVVINYSLILRD